MNETIGAKAGKNDIRRRLIITKKEQQKLKIFKEKVQDKKLEELKRKIKKQQIITFIKTLPIITIGQIYESLTENNSKKQEQKLKEAISLLEQENMFDQKELDLIIEAIKNKNILSLEEELLSKLGISKESHKQVGKIDLTEFKTTEKKAILSDNTETIHLNIEKQQKEQTNLSNKNSTIINYEFNKLKNHKIIDEYEEKLKEIRFDLRNLTFEYNLLSSSVDNLSKPKECRELLNKLTEIINKIEQLKQRIDITNINNYDHNYLTNLVEEYLERFNNNKLIDDIKDSELYIMISKKLEELNSKKEFLQDKIENKKKELALDESYFNEIKLSYFNYEKLNKELLNFQVVQDEILNDIQNKIKTAASIKEKTEIQIISMNRLSKRLLTILSASMLIPGVRSAKGISTMTATYLYFMRNIMRPKTITKKYKVLQVEDYSKEIENSIEELEKASSFIKKTSKQVSKTIKDYEKQFSEYIDILPEYKELLVNLKKIKEELLEKEYELKKIKEEQEKNLEKNNSKVKTIGYDISV